MNEQGHKDRKAPTIRYEGTDPAAEQIPFELSRERIEAVAERYRIPLYEDAGVVEALARLDVGPVIPSELYGVIAEVLGFVYRLDALEGAAEKE